MSGKIVLTMTGGELEGMRYRFDAPMLCIIGRADNSTIQITGPAGEGVSRHHCLLDIKPPNITIQDLGSRNGTYLNDINISEPGGGTQGIHTVFDGDSIRIANNVFRVAISSPDKCYICHKILPENYPADPATGHKICFDCAAAGLHHPVQPASKTLRVRVCVVCGTKVTLPPDSDESDTADFICADCRLNHADPNSTFRIPDKNELPSNLFDIPGYRILKRIGRGGMGEVFLGQDVETLEKVAVKILRPEIASMDTCREDFLREAENLKPLHHPNIIELKACRGDSGSIYLILEYCASGTLRNYIRQRGRVLDLRTALDLTFQILDALDYAHHVRLVQRSFDDQTYVVNGLVHRDIKPENIFITERDGVLSAKISDFGLAKAYAMAGFSGCTNTGDFSGSLGFISKQQFLNYKYARPEVDVWATAATLFFMLTGVPPRDFSGGQPAAVFDQKPYQIMPLNHEVTPSLASVIDSALDDTTALKYKSAMAFKFALEDAAKDI